MVRIRSAWILCAAVVAASFPVIVAVPSAHAASFTVTRFDDPNPNGCNPGDCSLREAIIAANATNTDDVIALQTGTYGLSRVGASEDGAATGDLDLTGTLTIVGNGSSATFIDGNGVDRVFHVLAGATVTMARLAIVDGLAQGPSALLGTGANGGGIFNLGALNLADVVVQGNAAGISSVGLIGGEAGRGGGGGGIANAGTLTLERVVVRGNVAGQGLDHPITTSGIGGSGGNGGGIVNSGTLTIVDSTIDLNEAGRGGIGRDGTPEFGCCPTGGRLGGVGGHGGGIYTLGAAASVTVLRSIIMSNAAGAGGDGGRGGTDILMAGNDASGGAGGAGGDGGGVYSSQGILTTTSTTIRDNDAGRGGDGGQPGGSGGGRGPAGGGGDGGGFFAAGGPSQTLAETTLSGNAPGEAGDQNQNFPQPSDGIGGGMFVAAGASAALTNVTVSGNTSFGDSSGGFHSDGILTATHTTVTGNAGFTSNGITTFTATIVDEESPSIAIGNFTSGGYNVFRAAGFPGSGSDIGPIDALLGPLQANSSPDTHALLPGSPAIDAIPVAACQSAIDARGLPRPQGAQCDIGAFELSDGTQVGLVDPSQGRWHLRDAIGGVDSFFFGNPNDIPFMGDWDCDGIDTPGLFRQSDAFAYLRNSNSQGIADIRFFFGNPDDIPLAGDWNGDGCDTLSLYRPSTQQFFIINALGQNEGGLGAADFSLFFGNPGDKPVVGDWDGDGVDEVGLHRESTGFFYWRNTLDTGVADGDIFFGDPGDRFVAGDWGQVDGRDTPAVFRPSITTFFFRYTLTQGVADSQFVLGEPGWIPVAGEFG